MLKGALPAGSLASDCQGVGFQLPFPATHKRWHILAADHSLSVPRNVCILYVNEVGCTLSSAAWEQRL